MAGLTEIFSGVRDIARAVTSMANSIGKAFPQVTGTATSATAGAQTLPANPVGFIVVTLPNGTSAKVPYYGS